MAVEARHLNLFHPQPLSNRGGMSFEGLGNVYGTQIGYGALPSLSGTMETMIPAYGATLTEAAVMAKTADSGLTYAVPVSRKRSRDAVINPLVSSFPNRCGSSLTFLGEDLSLHFQQQQLEVDRFIAQHTEKVRMGMEERRKRYSRRIGAALEENIMKKLKAKEAEIEKIGKLNWALEERVKSLCVENQIWRDVAQSHEATANALRCNLEQVLLLAEEGAAESCNLEEVVPPARVGKRMCRRCGKEESCVLLLPCRHLCLCTLCGSSLHTCPVCTSLKTASVHVNLSDS